MKAVKRIPLFEHCLKTGGQRNTSRHHLLRYPDLKVFLIDHSRIRDRLYNDLDNTNDGLSYQGPTLRTPTIYF
jgi:hypothetical protein